MALRTLVRKNDKAPSYEAWEVRWNDGHVIAGLPTRARAYGFADLVTAIQPMDQDITELKADVQRLYQHVQALERQVSNRPNEALDG